MFIFFPMGAILFDLGKVCLVPWAKYQGDVGQGVSGTLGKVPKGCWARYAWYLGQGTKIENEDFESCSPIKIKFLLGTYKVYVGTY